MNKSNTPNKEYYGIKEVNLIFDEMESNVRSYSRNFPDTFDIAKGSEIWTTTGKRYLDFLVGAGSLNYGHNDPQMKKALQDYIERDGIGHSLDLQTDAKANFLVALDTHIFKPRGLNYKVQFTGPTGTNAVEAALKLARKTKARTNVIAFSSAFHGVSMAALSCTENPHFRNAAGIPLEHVIRVPFCNSGDDDTLEIFEKKLHELKGSAEYPAAVIIECVQGEGGLNVASDSWLQRLELLCKTNDLLLIVDDIQAGCGRAGTFFSFERSGIVPDIITLSKSLSGYGTPLSIVLLKPELDTWKPAEHNGTFRGNNHAFVTATATLNKYWSTKDFEEKIAEKSQIIGDALQRLSRQYESCIDSLKGRGMMQGLCFSSPELAKKVADTAYEKGLIIERVGPNDEVLKLFPPLTISHQHLHEGISIIQESIDAHVDSTDLDVKPSLLTSV